MRRIECLTALGVTALCGAQTSAVAADASPDVTVGDAFIHTGEDGRSWRIGTAGVELRLEAREAGLCVTQWRNRLAGAGSDILAPQSQAGGAPFTLDAGAFLGGGTAETLWEHPLPPGQSVELTTGALTLDVKAGDRLGFAVAASADDAGCRVEWPVELIYDDGKRFAAAEDSGLNQGPVWFYAQQAPGTGCLDPLGERLEPNPATGVKERARVPAGMRAPFESPQITAGAFEPMNAYPLVRVWRAPAAGRVSVQGVARHASGAGATVRVLRLHESRPPAAPPPPAQHWMVESGAARVAREGGRPVAELNLTLRRDALRAHLRLVAYPGTPVLRQWLTLENAGAAAVTLPAPAPLALPLSPDAATSLTQYWLCGGTSRPNAGQLESAPVAGLPLHRTLFGERTDNLVPWTALMDAGGAGCFVALDHLGTWTLSLDRESTGPLMLSAGVPVLAGRALAPGERLDLPLVTMGVFSGGLDGLGERLYRWQYEYLWDYINADFYARPKWAVPWFFCTRNLQEQFAGRLAGLDMQADLMRELGLDLLWDDAGWSRYPGWPIEDSYNTVFRPSYEGPDFGQTIRYLGKMGMGWIAWCAGRPSAGVMDGKVGAWGDFQWRTDGVGRLGEAAERAWRGQVEHFLTLHPNSSFHTCDGGSRFAHQFEIQRLADVNFSSDLGRGDETNYFLSYLETPDRWADILEPLMRPGCRYQPATARGHLTMTPGWFCQMAPEDHEWLRRDAELYHYLLREGVAGRWSLAHHPTVTGDTPFYYFQRTSPDRQRAIIILKHQPPAGVEVNVRPAGLIPDHPYVVGFDSTRETVTRTGADLMTSGIALRQTPPGELIYIGLPHRPGSGLDHTPPTAPGRVYVRRESNIGHAGMGLYWSPGTDDQWLSFYEVRRGATVIGRVATGTYSFDHAPGWDPAGSYAVRMVDGDGNASDWTEAVPLPGEPAAWAALGGHFAEDGREGWRAETSADGTTFTQMSFVPPAKNPAGDLGGTPNQPGGVEGWWEGQGARLGRGWQQASATADCVRAWVAPLDGRVRVIGRVMKEFYHQDKGEPLRARILLGARPVWPAEGWATAPLNDLVGAPHDFTVEVKAGDTLRFVLGRCPDTENALAAWLPRIVYAEPATTATAASVAAPLRQPIRIHCGASEPYLDRDGNEWPADRYFTGGEPFITNTPITGTADAGTSPTEAVAADAALYQRGRRGADFTYAIPVEPGLYAVRLKLTEPEHEWIDQRPFNLEINGRRLLTDFDVSRQARGSRRALDRIFRYQAPDRDGHLVLHFTAGRSPVDGARPEALVQAIEVLPEFSLPAGGAPLRFNTGADQPFIDWCGDRWQADPPAAGETVLLTTHTVTQATPTLYDQALYQVAASGRTVRREVAVPPGLYTVQLKFAELWLDAPGQRPMNISVNGRRIQFAWDPATAAGAPGAPGAPGQAIDLRATGITPDSRGVITVTVEASGAQPAILQGLVIE